MKNYIKLLTFLSFVTTLYMTVTSVMGADRTKFKTCEQSSFCGRNRNTKPFEQQWSLDMSTVKNSESGGMTAELYSKDQVRLRLDLTLTEKGALRMKINDLNSTRNRYEAIQALNPFLKFKPLSFDRVSGDKLVVVFGSYNTLSRDAVTDENEINRSKYKMIISASPFKVEVVNWQDKNVLVANGHGLMKFEEHQNLEQAPTPVYGMPKQAVAYDEAGRPIESGEGQSSVEPAGETTCDPIENPDGCTAENTQSETPARTYAEPFSTYQDLRPYGPMSVGMDLHFPNSDHIYGIPEHADKFSLRDTRPDSGDPYRLYNVDIFEYEINTPMSLYGAIPFMISHSTKVDSFGIYWLNPSETWIDIESNRSQAKKAGVVDMISNFVSSDKNLSGRLTHWFSETGLIDVWFMPGPDPSTVMGYQAEAFGTIPMPPVYSIGFHQCRWNYYTGEEVMQVQQGYDDANIPLDAIWLDIEYTAGRSKKYFTWDPLAFADHTQLAKNLSDNGRRLIAIIDPHIKKEPGYDVYEEGNSLNVWVKDPSAQNTYEGWCWPGASVWPDYASQQVSDWWSTKFDPKYFPGDQNCLVDIWNDMNEPSVFNGPEVTAPRDLRHVDGWEHRDLHNMYGFLMTKATYEGMAKYRGHLDRPFILTRSLFAGSQRYCAAWTGDNMANWEHLRATIPMLLSLSVAGMPFVGADVGGFFSNPESDELVIRWFQAGAFQPFFRAHAHHDSRRREAYQFSEETQTHLRNAIRLRYSYAPYWYTLFFESHFTGMPMMRPHWFHDPQDEKTFDLDDQHGLGVALLVKPVTEKGVQSVNVYLPGKRDVNAWFDLNNFVLYHGGQTISIPVDVSTIPLFQRAGTIIPRHYRMRRSLDLAIKDPVTLDIVLGKYNGKTYAHGNLYVDKTKILEPDTKSAIYKDISYYDELLHIKPSTKAQLDHGVIERIVIYNWPSDQRISSIIVADGEGGFSNGSKLNFKMDPAKSDGTSRLEIRRPQLSPSWKEWKLKIDSFK